tara:strand:- start:104 stop:517 length:414 start_codon:yes stop_codon:yes gene_type:complete
VHSGLAAGSTLLSGILARHHFTSHYLLRRGSDSWPALCRLAADWALYVRALDLAASIRDDASVVLELHPSPVNAPEGTRLPYDYGIEYLTSGLGSTAANSHANHVADSGCGVAASDPALLQDGYHLYDLGAGVVNAV